MKWLWRLLGGPADRPVKTDERNLASVKIGALNFEGSKSTERKVASSTVTLPPTAPRPDIAALQAKFAKVGSKKKRRHDKRGRGPQLPRYPNGVNPGGRH